MKKVFLLSVLMVFVSFLFAYTSDDLLKALKDKNVDEVRTILEDSDEADSKTFEELILEDSKRAVKKDDLDYAYSLAEIVLMYDFDNTSAQNLFTSIEKAKKSKAEVAAKEAEKKKQRQEEEEQKRKLEEYQAQKQKEEEAKIEHEKAVSTITKSNFPIYVGISPLAFDIVGSDVAKEYSGKKINLKYGMGFHGNIGFIHPYFLANAHVNYDFMFVSTGKKGMKSDLETRLTLGSPIISDIVRISAGYDCINYINSDKSVVVTDIYGGLFGIGVENVNLNEKLNLNLFFDFNTVAFASKDMNLAFDVDLTLKYDLPWKVLNKQLYVENNTVFNAFQIAQAWEYSIATRFVVGVGLND